MPNSLVSLGLLLNPFFSVSTSVKCRLKIFIVLECCTKWYNVWKITDRNRNIIIPWKIIGTFIPHGLLSYYTSHLRDLQKGFFKCARYYLRHWKSYRKLGNNLNLQITSVLGIPFWKLGQYLVINPHNFMNLWYIIFPCKNIIC